MLRFVSFRENATNEFTHGCNVLAELVRPWANTGRVVVADSYFASVQSALRLYQMGLRFIGVVKTSHKGFPMHYFQRVELPGGKGDHKALICHDDAVGCTLLSFVWADRDRRYFISTCASAAPGNLIKRRRWRQLDPTSTNNPPVLQDIVIRQTEAGEIYYSGCGAIDEHNRHRQEHLNIEKKLQVMQWDKRANLSLFGMMCVDAYKLKKGCQGDTSTNGGSRAFFEELASALIDNDYDRRSLRKRREAAIAIEAALTGEDLPDVDTTRHLTCPTPTKRRKPNNPAHRQQGRCMVCKKPSSHVCRACQTNKPGADDKQFWICNKAGKVCMSKHLSLNHTDLIK